MADWREQKLLSGGKQSKLDKPIGISAPTSGEKAARSERRQFGMIERTLGRAARRGDIQAAARLADFLDTPGRTAQSGVIRNAEENTLIDQNAAFQREQKGVKLAGGQLPQGQVNPGSQQTRDDVAKLGAASGGVKPENIASEFAKATKGPYAPSGGLPAPSASGVTPSAPAEPTAASDRQPAKDKISEWQRSANTRQNFAKDLLESDLIKSGDVNARKRAEERGKSLGISPAEITAFLNGTPGEINVSGAPKAIPVKDPNSASEKIKAKYAGQVFEDGDIEKARGLKEVSPESRANRDKESQVIGKSAIVADQVKTAADSASAKKDARFKEIEATLESEKAKSALGLRVQQKQTEDYFSDVFANEYYNNSIANNPLKNAFMDRRVTPAQPAPIDYDVFDPDKPNFGQPQPIYQRQYVPNSGRYRGDKRSELFTGKTEGLDSTTRSTKDMDSDTTDILGYDLNRIPSRNELNRTGLSYEQAKRSKITASNRELLDRPL